MFDIRVERVVARNIETVFGALSDHENYKRFPGVEFSELLEPGALERNGAGALRRVGSGPLVLDERITGFERPEFLSYCIESARPFPMQHEFGEIRLEEEDGGTRVVWASRGHVGLPLLGSLVLDRIVATRGSRLFGGILKFIEQDTAR